MSNIKDHTFNDAQSVGTQLALAEMFSHAAVDEAMQDAWNDICSDTGCHPLDIEHGKGKHLTFSPNHWANQVAKRLFVRAVKVQLKADASQPRAATVETDERCPTCSRTDYEEAHVRMRCRDPWHADDHLRARPRLSAATEQDDGFFKSVGEMFAEIKRLRERCYDLEAADRDHLAAKNGMEKRLTAEIDRLRAVPQEAGMREALEEIKKIGGPMVSRIATDALATTQVASVGDDMPRHAPQTIETAPRDGTHILAWRIPVGIRVTNNTNPPTVVHWFNDPDEPGFYTSVNERAPEHPFNPTHWERLPDPPLPTVAPRAFTHDQPGEVKCTNLRSTT